MILAEFVTLLVIWLPHQRNMSIEDMGGGLLC